MERNIRDGKDAVGLLTNGLIDRQQYYVKASILALIHFNGPTSRVEL